MFKNLSFTNQKPKSPQWNNIQPTAHSRDIENKEVQEGTPVKINLEESSVYGFTVYGLWNLKCLTVRFQLCQHKLTELMKISYCFLIKMFKSRDKILKTKKKRWEDFETN